MTRASSRALSFAGDLLVATIVLLKSTVEMGEYASTSEVVREALRDWSFKAREKVISRTLHLTENAEADLPEIWSYIAEDASETTAEQGARDIARIMSKGGFN